MLGGARFCVRTTPGLAFSTDRKNVSSSIPSNLASPPSILLSIRWRRGTLRSCRRAAARKPILICCDSSRGSSSRRSINGGDDLDHDYLEASLLVSETTMHYQMWRHGFRENSSWQSSSRRMLPFAVRASQSTVGVSSIGLGFLRRFKNPTIFLKISCDGDFLLPIIVGEVALERLMDASLADDDTECPDQYQFVGDAVEKLGYEVKMVKITKRVVNTYFAKLYLGKGNGDIISVDARPSDAINVAKICKAPIYVNKEIVLADAIRIDYGRPHSRIPTYDVILDSAPEGPDPLSEELNLVRNMNLAAEEERYTDAAMWRDKLMKLRKPT